jgi:AraC-like DNA-binding protein
MDQVLHFRPGVDNGDLTPILERHLMELLAAEEGLQHSCAGRVRELLARRLGRATVHINDIAAEMNTSVRTLRRHLMAEGTSFRDLLQERRQATIEAILRSPEGARLSALASRLSYSDSAVLSRAFKGWTGLSPRQYKKSRGA